MVAAKTIYFTRHAHSTSNELGERWADIKTSVRRGGLPKICDLKKSMAVFTENGSGIMNTPLSKTGRQQLETMRHQTGTFLKDNGIEVIFYSDYVRAEKTFEALFAHEANLLGIPCHKDPGLREENLNERYWYRGLLEDRTSSYLEKLLGRKEAKILVVGHGKFLRNMIGHRAKHFHQFKGKNIPNATTWSIELSASGYLGEVKEELGPSRLESPVQHKKALRPLASGSPSFSWEVLKDENPVGGEETSNESDWGNASTTTSPAEEWHYVEPSRVLPQPSIEMTAPSR